MMLPRGIRNNNPLNIRRSKDKWKGLRVVQADASFCQFETLEYGWRAAFYLLTRTYYHKYRLFTIRTIISKWAPPHENKTEAYITNVSRLSASGPMSPSASHQTSQVAGWRLALQWPSKRMAQNRLITSPCFAAGNSAGLIFK